MLQKNVIDRLPTSGRICSVHFDKSDFQDLSKNNFEAAFLIV